jgi:metacaspase-1
MQTLKILLTVLALVPIAIFAQNTKAYALIVGLKTINEHNYKEKYQKTFDQRGIEGVDLDIGKLQQIAKDNNYHVTLLRDSKATKKQILDSLEAIGKRVANETGKVSFMFYFSGHGDTIPDTNGDEASGYDEALVAYDDYVVDDDINVLLTRYFKKSENLMIVDACHSGTVNHIFLALDFPKGKNKTAFFANEKKAMIESPDFTNCKYDNLETIKEPYSMIYFGATSDDKNAGGGPQGGTFTICLDKVIRDAKYYGDWKSMTYRKLACRVSSLLNSYRQNLIYREIGENVKSYINNQPFKN